MNVLLVSTYELGHQPFGLASPAAWLEEQGHQVECADLCIESLDADAVRSAEVVAFYLPMHTATRLAAPVIGRVRTLNPAAHICCYGLYAPLNEAYLRGLGATTILGGEFEVGLVSLMDRLAMNPVIAQTEPLISLDRLQFRIPSRAALPPLDRYARLRVGDSSKQAGYTEASRGCKHLCRHCPIVPVYQGSFRVVQSDVVLADVRQQVAAGAKHITFGDPDFFNGPGHAMRIVESLHREWPDLTYDATIKIEHLLQHGELLPRLRDTGCLFVTSAVESVDDDVLLKLDKGHTRAGFIDVAREFRSCGLALAPTFIPFTPWTTRASYRELLELIAELDLIDNVAPVQLALRLLISQGSRLLELPDIQDVMRAFDDAALLYRWEHPDPEVDVLAAQALRIAATRGSRREIFGRLWDLATGPAAGPSLFENFDLRPRATVPYLDEPWFC
jgi:radical SAM superfamily enzyme YgiQ (UPF0313 family)